MSAVCGAFLRTLFLASARPVATHIKHDPAACAGLTVHRQPGELLQRFQHLTVRPDQFCQGGANDRDDRPVTLHIHVNVAVEVRYVEQALDVVGRDLALLLQVGRGQVIFVDTQRCLDLPGQRYGLGVARPHASALGDQGLVVVLPG